MMIINRSKLRVFICILGVLLIVGIGSGCFPNEERTKEAKDEFLDRDITEDEFLESFSRKENINLEKAKEKHLNTVNMEIEENQKLKVLYKKLSDIREVKGTNTKTKIEVELALLYDQKEEEYIKFIGIGEPKISLNESSEGFGFDGGDANINFSEDKVRISYTGQAWVRDDVYKENEYKGFKKNGDKYYSDIVTAVFERSIESVK